MRINDVVYGEVEITEPVLLRLIESAPIQRLRGISQFTSYPKETYNFPIFSRYEHCVGTMLLLKHLGADIREQIAGLLHDSSHTAYSHVGDLVFGDYTKQTYHDELFESYIGKSEIPGILKTHSIDFGNLLPLDKFGLLDRGLPDLCADRVDYSLREFHYWTAPDEVPKLLKDLTVAGGRIVFKTRESADIFAKNYFRLYSEHWGSPAKLVREYLFSEILKDAVRKKLVTAADFLGTDDDIDTKLDAITDSEIKRKLTYLKKGAIFEADENGAHKITIKYRYVDPEFLENGKLRRLSDCEESYKMLVETERAKNAKGLTFNLK